MDFRSKWKSARKKSVGLTERESGKLCYAVSSAETIVSDSIAAILYRLLASTRHLTIAKAPESFKDNASCHDRGIRTEMRPSMPGSKALSFLKAGLFSYALAFRRFPSRQLAGAHQLAPFLLA